MIDWYYHDPDTGRVGPLSAAKLRKRFQERRIQRDTLLWHHDLRELQPLEGLARTVGDYALRTGRCPDNDDPHVARLRRALLRRASSDVRFASTEGGCAFELALNADSQLIDGQALRHESHPDAGRFVWQCDGGPLHERYRPYECRSDG